METGSRRLPLLAAILSGAAIAIVVAAAGGAVPARIVPTPPGWVIEGIPHVNAGISVAAIVTILLGWRAIRRGSVGHHRLAMLGATTLFATFLVLYLYRLVVIGGAASFPGPSSVYYSVYLPVLTVHMGLAIVCIPLVIYTLVLGLFTPTIDLPETAHARVGRVAAALWILSFAGGIVVYALLYQLY